MNSPTTARTANSARETKEALMDFQRDEGLEVDGEYGEKSHAALMDALSDEEAGNEDGSEETDTPAEPEEPKPLGVTVAITGGSVLCPGGQRHELPNHHHRQDGHDL